MGLFDRLRSAGSAQPGDKVAVDAAAEQEALCLIDEGNVIEDEGRLEAALERYDAAARTAPHLPRAHLNRGNVLLAMGRTSDALEAYGEALKIDPRYAAAQFNLGNALERSDRRTEALAAYRSALESRPDFAEAEVAMGALLEDLGQLDPAAAAYRRALRIKPDYAEAHANLGITLRHQGQIDAAVASLLHALELKPDFPDAHNNLGLAFRYQGQLDAAVACFRRALELKPDFVGAHNNLGLALQDIGRLDEAIASYRRVAELTPDSPIAHSNLLFCLSHDESVLPETLFAEHRRFGEIFEAPLRSGWPRHRNARDPDRRLQVGIVSADLRDHPVAHFIEPVLMHLAQLPSLSLHAYNAHAGGEDCVSHGLRSFVARWDSVATLSDAQFAERVERDAIDILIDLSGHTGENRLVAFARKPAPVQATWIGYPGTTGLEAMDYYVADRHFLPAGAFDGQFTEKIVRLPAIAPFLPDDSAPPVNALPALRNGYVTFASFNRLTKLRPSVIALWSRLLRELPDARMLLGAMPQGGEHAPLIEYFARYGITRDRLELHERSTMPDYLALHHQVDLCLDTFPYTGGTTTNHALWMGVPTLTIAGPTPPSRHGAAILAHLGLEKLVAADADDFVAKGIAGTQDLTELAALRAALRERFERSSVRHPEVIAAGFERALRTMWKRWCDGRPPESFEVGTDAMTEQDE